MEVESLLPNMILYIEDSKYSRQTLEKMSLVKFGIQIPKICCISIYYNDLKKEVKSMYNSIKDKIHRNKLRLEPHIKMMLKLKMSIYRKTFHVHGFDFNTVILILPKLRYRFHKIPIKVLMVFFVEAEKNP